MRLQTLQFDSSKEKQLIEEQKSNELCVAYRCTYENVTKAMVEHPTERTWDCSEMFIFTKLNTFQLRLGKLKLIMDAIRMYQVLDRVKISGTERFSKIIKDAYEVISTKVYDPLAHRLREFDTDYETFFQQLELAELGLQKYVKEVLEPIPTVDSRLLVLARYEKLQLECLCLDRRYLDVAVMMEQEIENLKDSYNADRADPHIPWCVPSPVGRMMWAHCLLRKLDEPIKVLRTKRCVVEHPKSQLCIKYYNYLAGVLIHYELLHHKAWYDYVEQVRSKLELPVLARDRRERLHTNLHPYVVQVIKETETVLKMEYDAPTTVKILVFCKHKVLDAQEELKHIALRGNQLRENIPIVFLPLLRPLLANLDDVIAPGLSTITWVSLNLPNYIVELETALTKVERFLKDVNDIRSARIEEEMEAIANCTLVYLPEKPVDPSVFYDSNLVHRQKTEKQINEKSKAIESSVVEMINRFVDIVEVPPMDSVGRRQFQLPLEEQTEENQRSEQKLPIDKYDWIAFDKIYQTVTFPTPREHQLMCFENYSGFSYDVTTLHTDCMEMFAHYTNLMMATLVKCAKKSLEALKTRANVLNFRLGTGDGYLMSNIEPFLLTHMELKIPKCVINLSLAEIQDFFDTVKMNIVETNLRVMTWGKQAKCEARRKRRPARDETFQDKNWYRTISENKEIDRFVRSFESGLFMLENLFNRLLNSTYEKFKYLWAEDRDEQITAFVETNPLTANIRDKFIEYDRITASIEDLPTRDTIGPIEIRFERINESLLLASKEWKTILGQKLSEFYKTILERMVEFIHDKEKILSRPLKDLDDVRLAMDCLESIRENFLTMDMDLTLMEDTYALFHTFHISIPVEDTERVDGLRYNFGTMIKNSETVQDTIIELQEPLKVELTSGVANFFDEVLEFDRDYDAKGPMVEGIPAKEASDRVLLFQARFDELWSKFEKYASGERLFGLAVNDYPSLHRKKKEFNLLSKLYSLYLQVMKNIDEYFEIPWLKVDIEKINGELTDFQNRCRRLPKGMQNWAAYIDLKKKIDDFSNSCPLLELMTHRAMKERHWTKMQSVLKHKLDVENPEFSLGDVMQAPLLKFKDDIEDICIGAVKEQDIESKLKTIISDWAVVNLQFATFKSRGELLIKPGETGDIILALEDSLMVMNSLASNRFNAPFKKDIMLWLAKLVNTGEILEKWLIVQNLWIYLEAVFVGGDISKQLPAEAKRFMNIDKAWMRIMFKARDNPVVVSVCTDDDVVSSTLTHLLEQLEACQKSLTGYLESKRLIFPRFFFISDPVLLEILGQSSDPTSIQAHLLSLFDAVAQVEFDGDTIVAMCSANGETVPLEKPVVCNGGVENWLGRLLAAMQESVKNVLALMAQQLADPEFDFLTEFPTFCGQAGLVGVQLLWTSEAEVALRRCRKDKFIMKQTNQRFLDLLNSLISLTIKNLTKLERIEFETMVTIHVHQRDIFDELVKKRIRTATDFEWQKQARFYYIFDTDDIIVKITDVDFIYQNEYLGVTERLCITPLTDRCYITLAQAIGMCMGGAPAGPAGTGKTETTKDMGRALGKLVVVFNCSDQMDFRGLGRIYKGLAQSGSWGCFDEFNRIELPVLSVAAQQISIVLTARKEKKTHFIFSDGDTVSLNREFGLFITMNPGYAGRQELPENLKIQFRSVAMMVPDRQIIIRVKLASCGFIDNVVLARKFFTLYKLCEEQLSKQVHYDFGLRNILSVLRTLGAQKRAHPEDSEETIVMRVLRDMNVSKLVDEDEPLFISLIEDLFPGIRLSTSTYKELQEAIATSVEELGLINHPQWNLKLVQLYETSLVRHGLMVLGPTGAGKTNCIHTLLRSFTENGQPHRELRMNPKAITAPQMFGRLDVATNDWTDGIFSTLWRRTLKFNKTEFVWLTLDGPVDAVWIENLNSVLDDNKTLTLANGDRITMAPNCKLVFEPDNVDNASPATVSRMGMVFMSASVLNWKPILDGWLKRRPAAEADLLRDMFGKIYEDLHNFVQIKLEAKMKIVEAIYIRQTCDVLEGLLAPQEPDAPPSTFDKPHLERLFLFSLMWSLGAVLELEDRAKLGEFVRKHPSKLKWPKIQPGELIFDYVVSAKGQWEHWRSRVEEYVYPSDSVPEYSSILVPNVDNVRTAFLIELIAKQKKAVLLIGEQGTAKTVMIKSYMSQYDPEYHLSKSLNFSSATTPNMFQRTIESYVEKRVGTTYGPPSQRRMTVFVDDINMPDINEWGDQITNEIVRQMMENKGFYSLDKPGDFSTILDIQMMGAMIHPGGGRNDIPPRLKRQFSIFNCALPSNDSMDQIFSVIGTGYFCEARFQQEVVELIPMLIPLTRKLWQKTKVKMLPTPAKFHYVFNLRDLSRIWEGLLKIKSGECETVDTVIKLWCHECTRVIADRFTNYEDREWFSGTMRKVAQDNLGYHYDRYPAEETYFVDFLKDPPEATGDEPDDFVIEMPFLYEEIHSYEETTERVLMFMAQYNEQVRGAAMDLVFFRDALVHLMIIYRILRTPRGNALLVGVGGSGKQSLTKLASFIAGYRIYQIQMTRSYNVTNLMEDLKYLYRVAGFEGAGITFIFTDNDIKDESFLEYLNNVLSSGEIANLFPKDELDEITSALVPMMKKVSPKRVPTQDNLYDFFISRARANLHVVLCFSPVGKKFRNRSLKFPGLISGCTVDWFQKWPKDALVAVSRHFLQDFPIVCNSEVKGEVIQLMAFVQEVVSDFCLEYFERFRRQVHVTPKSFLSFLDGYKKIYTDKHEQIKTMASRMETGLIKLIDAAASVDILKRELVEMNKEIVVANEAASKVMESVQVLREAAEVVKTEVLAAKKGAEKLVDEISVEKAVALDKLEAARPALEEAEAALKTVKATDIATVRRLGSPPHLITLIMDVVMILFRNRLDPVKPDPPKQFLLASWPEALRVMSDTRFLARIVEYQTDLINAEMVDLMAPYFNYPMYTFEAAKVACGNVAGLLQWTIAMAKFYEVNKEVLPLKANLARQQVKLDKAEAELKVAEQLLLEKEMELKAVEEEFNEARAKQQVVLDQAQACQNKMDAATALINGLAGERVRWTEQSALFRSEIERLVGDVLLLTGFLSYTGPFNQEFRTNLQKVWHDELREKRIPVSAHIDIVDSLTDSATVGEWNLQGLPNDELSVQNGIIVTKAARFPLLIDPQSQGKLWIKNKEKEHQLIVTSLSHRFFRNHIEDCVQLGYPMLIEDIGEELDPVLDNILEKNFIKVGTSYKVKIGDKEVDVNQDFRMYMTTKLPNPVYTPEISARTSIIDFTVTRIGLEDQLLGRVILTEKRELETERTNLITSVTANKRKMKELEANLLHKLSTVEGSLLDDVSVITVLNVSKATSKEVQQKLIVARDTELKINAAREEFRPVATRGSVLYFLICTMASVNHMYQTSLMQFLERFDLSMTMSTKSPITYKRIASIIEYLTYEIFKYKSRGLYEVHKYLFVLLMALNIDLQKEAVFYEEFQNFIKGGAALDINQCPAKPFKWITDITWLNLVQLSNLRLFANLLNQITNNEKAWKVWFDKASPEEESIPDGYQSLDPFRRLLLIRAWCPDRTLSQCRKYLAASLGPKYSDPVILNFDTMLEESRPLTPLICFLTMGSDPTPSVEALARRNGLKVQAISMGQGQEVHARKLVARALADGFWVLLQNCHLGLEYMSELVLLVMELEKKPDEVHPDFRLWMTTEEHSQFPITLLQLCIKFTNEPPSGLRAGLKRTYGAMTLEMFEYSESPYYLPLIFAVSFLHTVVQERRKFGALGWNIPYEFNSADWLASCMFMQNHLDDLDLERGISWYTIRYMLGEVQYGGRVTDDYDKRLLNTFTNVWFRPDMFEESFEFFKGYNILTFKTMEEYMEAFETMPTVDPPQVYGLHRNADITYQSNTTQLILDTILSVQPKESSAGGGETREAVVGRMAQEMLDKVPKSYDAHEVMERLRIMGHLNSMNIFLRQEIDRIQKIIVLVRSTLNDLLLAIEGTIIMNEQLRDALDNIFDARVPNIWRRLSWASSTLGFWFSELIDRNNQFHTWCFTGRPNMFWMTGFFNPQGFLTAMRQEVARAHKGWALDVVALHNDVTSMLTEECRAPPKEGVYVYGLYLDGAGWNRRMNCLQESLNKVLYTMMPVIHVYAINSTAPKDKALYECPVYKKPNRTDLNFITPLWVQTQKHPDHWTLRGVAMLCDIK